MAIRSQFGLQPGDVYVDSYSAKICGAKYSIQGKKGSSAFVKPLVTNEGSATIELRRKNLDG